MHAHENPYRVERLHALRFRFPDGDDFGAFWSRVVDLRRGAIVGAHGTGKTTLLGELTERLRDRGLRVRALRISAGTHSLARLERQRLLVDLTTDDAVLLDGASHLLPWEWWRFRRAARDAGFLIVTTHRPGRLPTLLRTASWPGLVAELTCSLGAPITSDVAARLHRETDGNVRDALRALYDRHARQGSLVRRA